MYTMPYARILLPCFLATLLAGCTRSLPQQNFAPLLLLDSGSSSAPTVISISPEDGTTGVSILGDFLTITFSEAMDPSTITMQSADGPCTGTIQITGDANFTNCPGGTVSTTDNINFTITPSITTPSAGDGTAVQVKVTTSAQSAGGVALAPEFQTSSGYFVFTPANFSGLLLWLQADKLNGFNDGDPLTAGWSDESGNGNNAFQGACPDVPVFRNVGGPNDQNYVSFDGGDCFQFNEFIGTSNITLFAVAQSNGAGTQAIFEDDDGGMAYLRYRSTAPGNPQVEIRDTGLQTLLGATDPASLLTSYSISRASRENTTTTAPNNSPARTAPTPARSGIPAGYRRSAPIRRKAISSSARSPKSSSTTTRCPPPTAPGSNAI